MHIGLHTIFQTITVLKIENILFKITIFKWNDNIHIAHRLVLTISATLCSN